MLTCKEASHLLSEHQERPLGIRERMRLRIHLWICVNCSRFERQLAMLRQGLRELGKRAKAESEGAELTAEARERIRAAMAKRREWERR